MRKSIVEKGVGENKYLYNGTEHTGDFGLDWNFTPFRTYDPAIARWGQVDPLAESFSSRTPYEFGLSNPILFVDPTGLASTYNWDAGRYEDEDGNEVSWNDVQNEYGIGGNSDVVFSIVGESAGATLNTMLQLESGELSASGLFNVDGSPEFVEGFNSDISKLEETVMGRAAISYLYVESSLSGIGLNITEAGLGQATDILALKQTVTYSWRKSWDINLQYSRINGVSFDGITSVSYITLAHELGHAVDFMMEKTGNRAVGFLPIRHGYSMHDLNISDAGKFYLESRATHFENKIRGHFGLSIRHTFRGAPIVNP